MLPENKMKRAICINDNIESFNPGVLKLRMLRVYEYDYVAGQHFCYHVYDELCKKNGSDEQPCPLSKEEFDLYFTELKN